MSTASVRRPLVPEDLHRTPRATSICRGITAIARGAQGLGTVTDFAKAMWPDDRTAIEIATKSAVTPASTTSQTTFGAATISNLISILGPASCAAQLFSKALQLQFGQSASLIVPNYTASATDVAFIGQGSPLPIVQLDLSSTTELKPQKMAAGFGLVRELTEGSNAEAFITSAMREKFPLAVDTLLLDDVAGTAVRPQGLRYNKAGLTATSGGGLAALVGDLAQLAAAVEGVSSNVVFIAPLKEKIKIAAYLPQFTVPVLTTGALADGTIACVAVDALAVCGSDQPIKIERSIEAVIHADTSPQPLTSAGTPNVAAFPLVSAFQVDAVIVRLIADLTWALRSTSAIAWTSSVTW
ncbi:hypothetical protein SAMN05216330_112147 [Bradyrhizobium sp. Ghvi]|uniref:hypothetical protein n=1 Tax=Bradyrhizobium sp. Ghvi TaxID=1855319 RepID=UPI0008F0BEF2|nr:hypothetical protein [Bradyrhizobium sp. Ghvi]SFP94952.1 hypothetical protein SAMN05216330_112147 [Bradyrhizobium sp. Ghvi]